MIIGLGHKIKSGKDTVAKMIQFLTSPEYKDGWTNFENWLEIVENPINTDWKIKRFADKIKEIVCLLIDCTLEQLEDHNFKNAELGKEWWYYIVRLNKSETLIPYLETKGELKENTLVKLTPRLLFNLIGTEAGRKIIHPNIWVNALFSFYQQKTFNYRSSLSTYYEEIGRYKIDFHPSIPKEHWGKEIGTRDFEWAENKYPDWIITDVRFPNEASAIKRKEGILVKIQRDFCFDSLEDYLVTYPDKNISKRAAQLVSEFKGTYPELVEHFAKLFPEETKQYLSDSHKLESETALDNFEGWDYIIDNNGTQEELLLKVKEFLEHYKII